MMTSRSTRATMALHLRFGRTRPAGRGPSGKMVRKRRESDPRHRINNLEAERDATKTNMLCGKPPTEPRYAEVPPVPTPAVVNPGRGGSIYENQAEMKRRPLAETTSS